MVYSFTPLPLRLILLSLPISALWLTVAETNNKQARTNFSINCCCSLHFDDLYIFSLVILQIIWDILNDNLDYFDKYFTSIWTAKACLLPEQSARENQTWHPKKAFIFSGAHQGGYWIPISREKIGHIPESRENFLIFPITNFPPRIPAEYLVFY